MFLSKPNKDEVSSLGIFISVEPPEIDFDKSEDAYLSLVMVREGDETAPDPTMEKMKNRGKELIIFALLFVDVQFLDIRWDVLLFLAFSSVW